MLESGDTKCDTSPLPPVSIDITTFCHNRLPSLFFLIPLLFVSSLPLSPPATEVHRLPPCLYSRTVSNLVYDHRHTRDFSLREWDLDYQSTSSSRGASIAPSNCSSNYRCLRYTYLYYCILYSVYTYVHVCVRAVIGDPLCMLVLSVYHLSSVYR